MRRRSFLAALTAVSVTGLFSGATSLLAQADRLLKVSLKPWNLKFTKDTARVAFPSYPVTFIVAARAKASTGQFGGNVDLSAYLDGPTEEIMRQLATEGYEDAIRRFTAAGYEVAPAQAVAANADLAKIGREPGNVLADSAKIDSRATKAWVTISPEAAPLLKSQGAYGLANNLLPSKMGKVAKAFDAAVLLPRIFIDFTNLNASKPRSLTTGDARVGGVIEFSIDPLSITQIITADKKGLGLFGSLTPTEQALSPVVLKGQLVEARAPDTMAAMFGKVSVHAMKLDMEDWKAQVRAALGGYNQAVVEAFVAARS